MSRVHRSVAARIEGAPRAVFVDTPAGFEPNVDEIGQKAIAYFERHLGFSCEIASFRHAATAEPLQVDVAVRRIHHANYVFAGPGSPTYAVRNWRGHQVFEAMASQLAAGVEVVLASAAAIASGTFALPVYEIYKAGEDLFWHEGCDLLAPYGLRLAIVPHWNNAEGSGFDTRFCYMGKDRFDALRAMLEPSVVVLGLDEYTACGLDFAAGRCEVMGAGAVTVLRGGDRHEYGAGESFAMELLRTAPAGERPPSAPAPLAEAMLRRVDAARSISVDPRNHPSLAAAVMLDLAEVVEQTRGVNDAGTAAAAEEALGALVSTWCESLNGGGAKGDIAPFVELLIEARRELRAQKAFAAADMIRDGLSAHGVALDDTRDGTTWRTG